MDRKLQLARLGEYFQKESVAKGIAQVFQTNPDFIKFFLFEIFDSNQANEEGRVELVLNTLSALQDTKNLSERLVSSEPLWCGVAALLRNAVSALFGAPEPTELLSALSQFIKASNTHFVLFSHCVFYVLSDESLLDWYKSELPTSFSWSRSPIEYAIRYIMCVSISISLIDSDAEEAPLLRKTLSSWIEGHAEEELKDLALFAVRQLSGGGTGDIQLAVKTAQRIFPRAISTHPILEEILLNLRVVSPLACLPGFSQGLAMSCKFKKASDPNQFTTEWAKGPLEGRLAMTAYIQFTQEPVSESNELPALMTRQLPAGLQAITASFCKLTTSPSHSLKELLLHLLVLQSSQFPVTQFTIQLAEQSVRDRAEVRRFRLQVEDALVPKCPRCRNAFVDWSGCFAVTCQCGCGFCGHCLQDCGADAHQHVGQAHNWMTETFEAAFSRIATAQIQRIMTQVPANLQSLIEVELVRALHGNAYSVKPENVLAARNANQLNAVDKPAVVNTMLNLLSLFGFYWLHIQGANVDDIEPISTIMLKMNSDVGRVAALLFDGNQQQAFKWIHAILDFCQATNWPGNMTQMQLEEQMKQICVQHQNSLQFLATFDRKCAPVSQCIKDLQLSETEVNQRSYKNSREQARQLVSLPRTVFEFKSQFWTLIASNSEKYSIFSAIHEMRHSISKQSGAPLRMLRMTQFIGLLTKAATELRISKEQAEQEGSFHELVNSYGEPLTTTVEQFVVDFQQTLPRIENWKCNQKIQATFGHLSGFPMDIKLACFLPSEKDLGILSQALWSGMSKAPKKPFTSLPAAQNILHGLIHQAGVGNPVNPYYLTEEQIVCIDFEQLEFLIDNLFVVPGYHDRLAVDLVLIESLVQGGAPQLNALPRLPNDLPSFSYGMDGICTLIKTLQRRLEQQIQPPVPLSNSVGTVVLDVMKNAPHTGEQIFSFCVALCMQLEGEERSLSIEALQIDIAIPLTEEQRLGMQILLELPSVSAELFVRHIPALMCLCWSKKPALHPSVDEDPKLEGYDQRIMDGLSQLVEDPQFHPELPALLTSLRFLGLAIFNANQTKDRDVPVGPYLENSIIDLDDFLERLPYDHPLNSIPIKYFGSLYRTAESLFANFEFFSAQMQATKVIPFAAVRQFLRTQRVTEQVKDKNSAAVNQNPILESELKVVATPSKVLLGPADLTWDVMDDLTF